MKICFFCKECESRAGFAYSELTWQSGDIRCNKGHWRIYGDEPDLVDVGIELSRAETCPDYSPAKGIPE